MRTPRAFKKLYVRARDFWRRDQNAFINAEAAN